MDVEVSEHTDTDGSEHTDAGASEHMDAGVNGGTEARPDGATDAGAGGTADAGAGGTTDAGIREYLLVRSALATMDSRSRLDSAKRAALTPLEKEADAILKRIKAKERQQIWNPEGDTNGIPGTPGMPLRPAIEKGLRHTDLWFVMTHMPKGGLLHCHLDGTVSATWLITFSRAFETVIHVKSDRPIDDVSKLYTAEVTFQALPDVHHGNIYSPFYRPGTWMSLKNARNIFPYPNVYKPPPPGYVLGVDVPPQPGSETFDAFQAWLHSLMTMIPAPGSLPTRTPGEAWKRFLKTFSIIGGFISYAPILRAYIKQMFIECIRDGIQYVEARFNFYEETYLWNDAETPLPHRDWVRIFEEELVEFKAELLGDFDSNGGPVFFDAKIIYVTVRIVTPERLEWYLEDCLELKRLFPDRIVGFDLVGYEDPGRPLSDYLPQLLNFQRQVAAEELDLPFLFHAGETLGEGSPADLNLFDAITLGTKRIGHGLSIVKHPALMAMCRARGICIEVCPISNEVLRYTGSVAQHPLPILFNHGIPVVLSNDDPCQFGNFGLSHDFYQVFTASDNSDLATLYTLASLSLQHARLVDDPDALCPAEKHRSNHRRIFELKWQAFCRWLVKAYGPKYLENRPN
ncbi:unnamed protein product [Parajaminaea phylloscopi]